MTLVRPLVAVGLVLAALALQVVLFPRRRRPGRRAQPGPAGRGGRGARPRSAVRGGAGLRRAASPSTSPRRPTTWPVAGPWPWSWWGTSPVGSATTPAPRRSRPWPPSPPPPSSGRRSSCSPDRARRPGRPREPGAHRAPGGRALGRRPDAVRPARGDGAVPPHGAAPGGLLMAAALRRSSQKERSRLRVIVIQALVLSLFATLFARLWYIQVLSGAEYQAQAAEQSVRELVVQPPARPHRRRPRPSAGGQPHLLGAQRGPHDARQDERAGPEPAAAPPGPAGGATTTPTSWSGPSCAASRGRSRARAGTARRTSRCRWPRTSRSRWPSRSWSATSATPACSRRRRACGPTPRPTASTPRTCWATSARSPRTSWTRPSGPTTPPSTEPRRWGARGWSASTTRCSAASRATAGSPSTRWAACSAAAGGRRPWPGDTLVTSIDAKVQAVVEQQLARTIRTARSTLDTVTGRNYVADSGAAVVMETDNGRIVAMASQPTYDPGVWVGGISQQQLARLYSEKAGLPAALARDPGPVRAGLDVEADHDRRRHDPRLRARDPPRLLELVPGGQPGVQELRVRRLRVHRLREGARGLLQHLLLPDRLPLLGEARQRRVRRRRASDPLVSIAKRFGFGQETGIDLPGEASGRIADRKWKLAY